MNNTKKDINLKTKLTLEEMYLSVTKQIKYNRNLPCSNCISTKNCKICKGTGIVEKDTVEKVNFPAGIESEMILTLKRLGNFFSQKNSVWNILKLGNTKKENFGNLNIHIEEIKHNHFIRINSDLIYTCSLKKSEVETTDKLIEIKHLNNEVIKIQIPKGVNDGKILRLKDKGFKNISTGELGSLLVRIHIIDD